MAKKREFGERNQALSNDLLAGKVYYDWVVTTAFYSAIHFVEDFALPVEINGRQCEDIGDVKNAYKTEGRHAARERLVFGQINSFVGARYKWLDDHSRNARYKTYKAQPAEALKAQEYLNFIHKHCYPILEAKEEEKK
ncbi:hypothetical protein AB9T89_12920 [Flavobacterium oncorhynchi]|uniref:hypothetical protein n=1 Tax=Flavobacterium oncorhynchi TaxID=728056 RepID=UPI00351A0DA0